jgi:hypothetical protein
MEGEPADVWPYPPRSLSAFPARTGAMTLIAEKEGHEVAKIHGPHRTEFVLEYHDPESGHTVKLSRSNLHVLRSIAEHVFPELIWKE